MLSTSKEFYKLIKSSKSELDNSLNKSFTILGKYYSKRFQLLSKDDKSGLLPEFLL